MILADYGAHTLTCQANSVNGLRPMRVIENDNFNFRLVLSKTTFPNYWTDFLETFPYLKRHLRRIFQPSPTVAYITEITSTNSSGEIAMSASDQRF